MQNILEEIWQEVTTQPIHSATQKPKCNCTKCKAQMSKELEIIGIDTRKRIKDTRIAPFRYICHIEITRKGVAEPGRTGVLLNPYTVLTAAHCIWDERRDKLEDLTKVQIRVIPGRNGNQEPFGSAKAVKLIASVGYHKGKSSTAADYGIIHLDKPIGSRSGYWRFNHFTTSFDTIGNSILKVGKLPLPASQIKVNLSGYPTDKGGTMQYSSYDQLEKIKDGMLHYVNDTFKGHSGSPVWIKRSSDKGGRVLIGIHVAGDDASITGKANRAVFMTPSVVTFISKNIKYK
jgi:V8-like Glu-specific endopeptidase